MLTILAIAALLKYQKPETVLELAFDLANKTPEQKPDGYG